jgi:NAD(P)H-dependent FMN reductase
MIVARPADATGTARAGAATTLLGISTSLKGGAGRPAPSAARSLLEHALTRVARAYPDVALLDLRDHEIPFFDGRGGSAYGSDGLDAVSAAIEAAGGIVLSVPAYWNGISGVFKNLVDCLCGASYDGGGPTVLAGKPVGVLVVGADAESARLAAGQASAILRSTGAVLVAPPVVTGNPRQAADDASPAQDAIALAAGVARQAHLAARLRI